MSAKKLKPLGNKIVVKRNEAKATKGGILLPESAKEKPRQGIVLAVGPGKVLFSSYSGTEYKADEQEYLILSEDDVLAILN